jgi:hypothetical protein
MLLIVHPWPTCRPVEIQIKLITNKEKMSVPFLHKKNDKLMSTNVSLQSVGLYHLIYQVSLQWKFSFLETESSFWWHKEEKYKQPELWSLIFGSSNLPVTTHQNFMCSLQSHLEFSKSNYLSYYPFAYSNMFSLQSCMIKFPIVILVWRELYLYPIPSWIGIN